MAAPPTKPRRRGGSAADEAPTPVGAADEAAAPKKRDTYSETPLARLNTDASKTEDDNNDDNDMKKKIIHLRADPTAR